MRRARYELGPCFLVRRPLGALTVAAAVPRSTSRPIYEIGASLTTWRPFMFEHTTGRTKGRKILFSNIAILPFLTVPHTHTHRHAHVPHPDTAQSFITIFENIIFQFDCLPKTFCCNVSLILEKQKTLYSCVSGEVCSYGIITKFDPQTTGRWCSKA